MSVIYVCLRFIFSILLLKHDVMYHHGMGGPPQRPLQVRNFHHDNRWQAHKCLISQIKNFADLLSNFTNNWTPLDKSDYFDKFEFRVAASSMATFPPFLHRHVATLKRASSNVNWVVVIVLMFSNLLIVKSFFYPSSIDFTA